MGEQLTVNIDEKEIEQMASSGSSWAEMADFFGVSDRTLRTKYYQAYKRGISRLKHSLRSTQVEVALGVRDDEGKIVIPPNITMLIWLGKVYLGQRDPTVEIKILNQTYMGMGREDLIKEAKKVIAELEQEQLPQIEANNVDLG